MRSRQKHQKRLQWKNKILKLLIWTNKKLKLRANQLNWHRQTKTQQPWNSSRQLWLPCNPRSSSSFQTKVRKIKRKRSLTLSRKNWMSLRQLKRNQLKIRKKMKKLKRRKMKRLKIWLMEPKCYQLQILLTPPIQLGTLKWKPRQNLLTLL